MLRLFMSVDIAGSTEFKTRNRDPKLPDYWPRIYQSFLQEFPAKLFEAVRESAESAKVDIVVDIWKLLGDEIVFDAQVADPRETALITQSFYSVLHSGDAAWRRDHGLRLKGTAFTAEFPNENKHILVGEYTDGRLDGRDFIGPDIDLGFRIAKVARPGRLVVSMDLADILSQADWDYLFEFHWVGWEQFKGVYSDRPYPVIWITTDLKPHIYPWEQHFCPYTKAFEADCQIGPQEVRDRIREIRDAMNETTSLKLFAPYFSPEEMPAHHKEEEAMSIEAEPEIVDLSEDEALE